MKKSVRAGTGFDGIALSTSINGANEAISAIDTELDARGIVIDTSGTVPTAIFNLRLVSKTSTTIRIVWDKGNETYVAKYLMSRQLASGGATTLVAELNPLGDFPSGFATYSGLPPLTSYVLTIQARSATGVLGPASSITVTTSSVEA